MTHTAKYQHQQPTSNPSFSGKSIGQVAPAKHCRRPKHKRNPRHVALDLSTRQFHMLRQTGRLSVRCTSNHRPVSETINIIRECARETCLCMKSYGNWWHMTTCVGNFTSTLLTLTSGQYSSKNSRILQAHTKPAPLRTAPEKHSISKTGSVKHLKAVFIFSSLLDSWNSAFYKRGKHVQTQVISFSMICSSKSA